MNLLQISFCIFFAQIAKINIAWVLPLVPKTLCYSGKVSFTYTDVDPVARMGSFRALKRLDPYGVLSHPKTLQIG
jgi:hypothetical protein